MAAYPTAGTTHIDPKILGRRRLAALRRRARRIRVWVVCVAVTVFLVMFAAIYVQMARGLDPVLGASGSSAKSTASTSTGTSTSSTVVESTSSSDDSSSSQSTSAASPAPVTTQQS